MSITAKEIAARLGVSPAAVSLAVNGRPGLAAETRERILAEAARLGYATARRRPPAAAPNIRYVIFLDRGDAVKETSFYSIVLQGIEAKAKEYGYNVLISYFYADQDWAEQLSAISADVTGVILLATEVQPHHLPRLLFAREGEPPLPTVLVDIFTAGCTRDSVSSGNLQGAGLAVRYLLDKGHPDVGYLRCKSRITSFDERQAGLLAARQERGLTAPLRTVEVSGSSEQAFWDLCAWLDAGHLPPTAFFADNDIIAAACIRAFKARGYQIPGDISIVGFDDMPLCTMIDPPLTTIRVMKQAMGSTAMDILHRRIHSPAPLRETGTYHITISGDLIARESTAALPLPE